jgi:arginine repressor
MEAMLADEGARVVIDSIKADIADQLNAGGNVLYTAVGGPNATGAARVAESAQETRITGMIAGDEGVFIGDAQFTNEALVDAEESQSESSANQ